MGSKPVKPVNYDETITSKKSIYELPFGVISLYNKVLYDSELHPLQTKFFMSAISGRDDVMLFIYTQRNDILALRFNSFYPRNSWGLHYTDLGNDQTSVDISYMAADKALQLISVVKNNKLVEGPNRWFISDESVNIQSNNATCYMSFGQCAMIYSDQNDIFNILHCYAGDHTFLLQKNQTKPDFVEDINNVTIKRIVAATT